VTACIPQGADSEDLAHAVDYINAKTLGFGDASATHIETPTKRRELQTRSIDEQIAGDETVSMITRPRDDPVALDGGADRIGLKERRSNGDEPLPR